MGLFQGCTGLWAAGCWLARRLHQLKVSTTVDLSILIFPIFVQCVALRNLDLLIKTGWSVICPLCFWERWSWVGDSNPSRSRLLSIWSKEVWWTVLTLVGAIAYRIALLFVAIWIPVGLSSGLSPWCDPLTFVPLCDHKRDWHLIGLWLTCCVTVVSSVARTIRWMCESTTTTTTTTTNSGYVFFFIILYIKNPSSRSWKNIVKWLRQCFFLTS